MTGRRTPITGTSKSASHAIRCPCWCSGLISAIHKEPTKSSNGSGKCCVPGPPRSDPVYSNSPRERPASPSTVSRTCRARTGREGSASKRSRTPRLWSRHIPVSTGSTYHRILPRRCECPDTRARSFQSLIWDLCVNVSPVSSRRLRLRSRSRADSDR